MDMDIMTIFDAIILVFGIYMVVAGLNMKKTGKISSAVITPEEILKCKDKAGFIDFMYWKEAAFGGLVALVGLLGLINDLVISLGMLNVVEMIAFLVAFAWFQHQLRAARKLYI